MDSSTPLSPQLVYRAHVTAFTGGIVGGLLTTFIFFFTNLFEVSHFNPQLLFGNFLVSGVFGALFKVHGPLLTPAVWMVGFIAQLGLSGVVGWLYKFGFKVLGRSGWDLGAALGVIHWVIGGCAYSLLAAHGKLIQDLGYYGLNLGIPTFFLLLLSHLLFGTIVGGLYLPARSRVSDPIRAAIREGRIFNHSSYSDSPSFSDSNRAA